MLPEVTHITHVECKPSSEIRHLHTEEPSMLDCLLGLGAHPVTAGSKFVHFNTSMSLAMSPQPSLTLSTSMVPGSLSLWGF